MLEKTPSDWMPLPYTLDVVGATDTGLCGCADCPPFCAVGAVVCVALLKDGVELPRTKRCLSSGSSSLSSPSASKASARSELTVLDRSLEDALEWKDGGGELGTGYAGLGKGAVGVSGSSTSWALTCEMSAWVWSRVESRTGEGEERTRSYRPDMVEEEDLAAAKMLLLSPQSVIRQRPEVNVAGIECLVENRKKNRREDRKCVGVGAWEKSAENERAAMSGIQGRWAGSMKKQPSVG
jgi:hypothetical protein